MALESSGDVFALVPIVTRAAAAQGRQQRALQGGDQGAVRFEYLVEAASHFSSKERGNSGEIDSGDSDKQTTVLMDSSRKHALSRVRKAPRTRPFVDENTPQDELHKIAQAKLLAALNSAPLLHSSDMCKAFPYQATNRIQRISRSLFSLIVHNQRTGQPSSLEPNLRAQLGDSPDTSKALRSLVSAGLVQREGRGGRSDTFRYKIPRAQWARLELATAAFTSLPTLAPTTIAPASASEQPTATNADEPVFALPLVDCPPATANGTTSIASSVASLLCGSEATPLQDLLDIPHLRAGSRSLSLTQPYAASGGGRGSGTVYSQGSVILCDTSAGRTAPRNAMPPAKAMRTAGIASPAAANLMKSARSSGESGAQGSHAPPESEREQGKHSTLLRALPQSWGQENAHSYSSQASMLRLALATPQFPPPLFLSPSQAPSRSVGTPITNLTANPAGPLSSAYLPLSNAIITSGDTKALLGAWPRNYMQQQQQQQHHDYRLYRSTESTQLQQPLPSGEGVYQPPPAPTAADAFPFATSRKAALLERGPSAFARIAAPEQ